MKKNIRIASITAAFILAASCEHYNATGTHSKIDRNEVTTNVGVTIKQNSTGEFTYSYDGDFVDQEGNFDFTQKGAQGNAIIINFQINSAPTDMRFRPVGTDAIWIAPAALLAEGASPTAAYDPRLTASANNEFQESNEDQGSRDQFSGFSVSSDGKRLTLTDENNDNTEYRYGLRFDLRGELVMHDPHIKNGTGN